MLKVDLFRAILRFFLLSEWCILLGSFRVLLCLRIDYLFLYDRSDDIDQDLICLQRGLVVLKLTLDGVVPVLNVETAGAGAKSMFKFASVSKAVWQFQLADTVDLAAHKLTRVGAAICVENLTVTIGLVLHEVALEDITVTHKELPKARAHIHDPVALVALLAHIA